MADLWYIDRHWHGSLQVDIGFAGPFTDNLTADNTAERLNRQTRGDLSFKSRRVEGVLTVEQARVFGMGYAEMMIRSVPGSGADRCRRRLRETIDDLAWPSRTVSSASQRHADEEAREHAQHTHERVAAVMRDVMDYFFYRGGAGTLSHKLDKIKDLVAWPEPDGPAEAEER